MENKVCKKSIWVILFVLTTWSCNELKVTSEGVSEEVIDNPEILNITEAFEKKEKFILEDNIKDVKITQLETRDNSVLANIEQIIIIDNYIYIRDRFKNGSVAIFDINGKFLKRIPNGGSQSEIGLASAMDFDKQTQNLYVYDGKTYKINKYSADGKYVESYYLDDIVGDFVIDNNNLLYIIRSFQDESELFVFTEKEMSSTKSQKTYLGKEPIPFLLKKYIHKCDLEYNITYPWNNSVFCYKNHQIFRKYVIENKYDAKIDYSKYTSAFEMLDNISTSSLVFDGVFLETKDVQIVQLQGHGGHNISPVYRNKETKECFTRDFIHNSLYGSINCEVVYDYNGNRIVGVLFPEFIKDEKNPEWAWDKSNPHDLISDEDMKKLKEIKNDDNPLIITYRLEFAKN